VVRPVPAEAAGRDEEAVTGFVERFSAELTEAGFPRMAARVFVTVMSADSGRLTAPELMASLQASAAAISTAVRYLIQVQLLDREHEPGSRKDHYRVRDDVWHEATIRRDKMLLRWDTTLRDGVAALGTDTPAGARISETLEFFAFLQRELPALLDRWLASRVANVRGEPLAALGGWSKPGARRAPPAATDHPRRL